VRLGPCEVDHRGAPRLSRNHAEVDLEPLPRQHARLGLALGEDAFDDADPGEGIHHRHGVVARHEEIDVADRLDHPAE
jgi:hypothetical protein